MNASGLLAAPVQPGDVIRGKYRVERLLGQGGMAYVVSAWHLHLEQRVAMKLLRPETGEHPEVITRFLREARAVSKLEGSHVARILDVDTLDVGDVGAPFMVLEYLEGKDLAHVLHDHAPLAPHDVARWVRQACLGVAEAHELGIVHRDVKPANLFLAQKRSGDPVIKVLDFGISMLLQDTRITQAAVGMGSAEYMSPEQMRSAADVDARTDLWALGITLYELCTGTTPFRADGVGQVAIAVLTVDPAPPRRLRPDLPAGLEAIILRCLEKDPARRHASATELAAALAPFAEAPVAAGAALPPLSSRATSGPASVTAARVAGAGFAMKRALPVILGALIAVVAVVVVIVAFVLGRRGGDEPSAAAPGVRFKIEGATLKDQQSKLTWQRAAAPGAMDWATARAYCEHQTGDFRLPDVDELSGLLAFTQATPPLDAASFPTTAVDVFWSATEATPGVVSVVHFSTGRRATSVVSARNRTRCVR